MFLVNHPAGWFVFGWLGQALRADGIRDFLDGDHVDHPLIVLEYPFALLADNVHDVFPRFFKK